MLAPTKKRILVLCPSFWDFAQLKSKNLTDRYDFIFFGEKVVKLPMNASNLNFNLDRFINKAAKKYRDENCEAVIGPHDFMACLFSALLAEKLETPGPPLAPLLLAQHKYVSRLVQREVAPDFVPEFWLADLEGSYDPPRAEKFPIFIKPIKATFSILARKIENPQELKDFLKIGFIKAYALRKILKPFNLMLERYTDCERDCNCYILEELLTGDQLTVEGYVQDGRVQILETFDSLTYPDTHHFVGFTAPSRQSPSVLERAHSTVQVVIEKMKLDQCFFNVEFFYDQIKNRLSIIEVNTRMCYQFADLYEKIHGFNTYELQIQLALGQKVRPEFHKGQFQTAGAFALRSFQDRRVTQVPSEEKISELEKLIPESRIVPFGIKGRKLSSEPQDIGSYLYALLNIGGSSYSDLLLTFNQLRKILDEEFGFENEPLLNEFFEKTTDSERDQKAAGSEAHHNSCPQPEIN